MPKVNIISPAFNGDVWLVEINYGFHSSPYARCATKAEANEAAKAAKASLAGVA